MDPPPTVLAIKQAFLARATRQLAQPLAPSRAWRRKNTDSSRARGEADTASSGPRLPPKTVDDVLLRANQRLLQHARRAYAPAAVRHVAEQLDQLYEPSPELDRPESGRDELDQGLDYTTDAAIAGLPPAWDDPGEAEALPLEARRYEELVTQLQDLAARRAAARGRVQRLCKMVALLEPLAQREDENDETAEDEEGDAAATLQDNLVTRDGPVERELERMRVLLARVGDRVAGLPQRGGARPADTGESMQIEDVETVGQRRVQALLEKF